MPQVHDIGPKHFTHVMKYPTRKFPIVDRGETQEIEEPFRVGNALVVRIPLTRTAVVIGHWVGSRPEEEALATAIQMRELDVA